MTVTTERPVREIADPGEFVRQAKEYAKHNNQEGFLQNLVALDAACIGRSSNDFILALIMIKLELGDHPEIDPFFSRETTKALEKHFLGKNSG